MHMHKIEKQVNYLNSNNELVSCAHDMDVFNTNYGKSLGKFSDIYSFKKVEGELNLKQFLILLFLFVLHQFYIKRKNS